MYCYVIFGESDDKHTRKYLYKCDELTPGDTVIVPVKNSQKIALVYNTLKTIPKGLMDNRIKKSGMNPKALQYLMGHSDISVTLNTYTHVNLEDAREEVARIQVV